MQKIIQGVFFIALGALFIGVGYRTYQKYAQIESTCVKTTGKVVVLAKVAEQKGVFQPKITFKDKAGISHVFTSPLTYKQEQIAKGDTLAILYDPKHPDKAFLYNSFNLRKLPWLIIITGIVLCAGGILVLAKKKKRQV